MSGIKGNTRTTVGLSGTSNRTINGTCTDNAGNSVSGSHTYRYSTCARGENTCRYGCDTCSNCVGGWVSYTDSVWVPCKGATVEQCPSKMTPANCKLNDGWYSKFAGPGLPWCCRTAYDSCASGGYYTPVRKSYWDDCKTVNYYSCRCSNCYYGHNTCEAGFVF